jgi:ABC-2 type transport system ATP-binding protein
MTDLAIRARGLVRTYGARRALDGLDLEVPRGVVYGFLGPNGAGKTTTMRILTGLIRHDAGSVEILGRPLGWGDREPLYDVGALIESPSFFPYLSARDNLRVLATTGRLPSPGRIDEVLELVGLTDRAGDRLGTYSLGMKQRLGIAAALLNDPALLLLDEPANGLDPAGIVGMRQTLQALAAAGKTVLVSSHILPEIQAMAEEVAIIAAGRHVRAGRLDEMLTGSGQVRVRVQADQLVRAMRVLEEHGIAAASDCAGPGWFTADVPPERSPEVNRALVLAEVPVAELATGGDLERLFLSLTETAA